MGWFPVCHEILTVLIVEEVMELDILDKLIERAEKAMGKKLSTKKRNKLKDSVFCGPGRSFPVNDCAHYTAALRLLNKSKYSDSTKKSIRACINRRGKKLKCGGAKKAKAYVETNGIDINAIIESEIFALTVGAVKESIKNPNRD